MQLCDACFASVDVFFTVLPCFVNALPPHPGIVFSNQQPCPRSSNHEELTNKITLLRFEIQDMQNVLTKSCTERDMSADEIERATHALEDVLVLLEGLIDISILGHHEPTNTRELQKFDKLAALSTLIRSSIYPNTTTMLQSTSGHASSGFLKFISYGTDAVDFQRIYTEIHRFNTIMRSVFDTQTISTAPQIHGALYNQYKAASEEDKMATQEIHRARVFSDIAKSVFAHLSRPLQCGESHRTLIHLTGFARPEIDMIMSVCGANSKERWHLVSWSREDDADEPEAPAKPVQTICSVLRRSWKHKRRLRFHMHQNGDWDVGVVSSSDRMERNVREPKFTLEDLLHRRPDEGSDPTPLKLLKRDKLDFAVSIARSLLYLLGSPLLDDAWTAGNIYVDQACIGQSHRDCTHQKPYIRHEINPDHSHCVSGYSGDRRSFVLRLGVLLWELLFGHKITVTSDDKEEDDEDEEHPDFSLFNALNREEINARETFVERPFLDIIANCLNVYSQEQSDDPGIRREIYWKIVKPLEDYRKAYQPAVLPPPPRRKRDLMQFQAQCYTEESMVARSSPQLPSFRFDSQQKRRRYNHFLSDLEFSNGTIDSVLSPFARYRSPEGANISRIAYAHGDEQTSDQLAWGLEEGLINTGYLSTQAGHHPSKYPTLNSYSVGVVCALPKELLPIRILFDEKYKSPGVPPQDANSYSFGRIGRHYVVAACLPSGQYGSNSAAHVISHMTRTFPAMRFCLLVGIGAGIPTPENDIRLGDVVVSHPSGTHSGVIQHDQIKVFENHKSQLTGFLCGPPSCLLRDISNLMSNPDLSPEPLQEYIECITARRSEYKHPGVEHDRLFQADSIHDASHTTCDQCTGNEITRSPRTEMSPRVHYGLIASGNQLIKSAQARDDLSLKYNALCFEMEAAGVMNASDCLVIRGICDYADSHKNDLWQNYAAAAAAAYAKLLLTMGSDNEL